ncbi:hypothetical protein GGTG_13926 [Gaeumannomyces tritici R3-111a-1]|uniref:Uncharacterized protein n=1 Tax=Gaeumannomyces tritici (strain R3-111a-1) TaxID=644352 RepID=J3PK76_GAET3|nr:hypothetical protein GGTG_13926 [Gaeumannomyces tritici R3-111a-1]EJT68496.1 hypothetical protein GGTG_13926 [Gaeumannomyces tritici R3-111a-1]
MSIANLLLNRPIPRESIELGRLVLDPKYPDQDFCQPYSQSPGDESPDAIYPIARPFEPDVATQRLENFHTVLERTRGTRLGLSLLKLLAATDSAPTRLETITAPLCVIHQLRNASAYFSAACRETHVRTWLEKESQRLYSKVYLVCGFKTLTDARVSLARCHKTKLDASVAVSAVIAAAGGVPALGSDLDIGGSFSLTSGSAEEVGYTAAGEQGFAVQYRKIHFSRFSTQKVDKAYLEKGNRWKSYVSTRAGEDTDEGVDAEVAGTVTLLNLMGTYESVDLDGEQILYRVDEGMDGVTV